MRTEGKGSGSSHTRAWQRSSGCPTDAESDITVQTALLRSEESWEVFKHFQPQHPFPNKILSETQSAKQTKRYGKGEGRGSLTVKTHERGSENVLVRSLNLLNGQFENPWIQSTILQMEKLRTWKRICLEHSSFVVTLLGPESMTLRLWWPGLCSSHCLGKMWRRRLLPPQPMVLSLSLKPTHRMCSSPVKHPQSSSHGPPSLSEGQWDLLHPDESCGAPEDDLLAQLVTHGPGSVSSIMALRRSCAWTQRPREQDLLAAGPQDISLYKDGISWLVYFN